MFILIILNWTILEALRLVYVYFAFILEIISIKLTI